ncbi:MAG: FAD binding domain-containing protein [Treponema sp.]|jgi:CO/xanthine dehydrogenase FAD-binding subunit|nr:FAD binding domain-containing protein [Treponema sp.]
MDVSPNNQAFFPASFGELFSAWSKFPDAAPFAGGTEIMRRQGGRCPCLPRNILCLDKLADLRRVTRTERYLELGAMVTLNEIIRLGKAVPEVFIRCLELIAGSQVRNIATIGGNLCYKVKRLDASAPLIGLDALYELRCASSARWIAASRFSSLSESLALNEQELLTRIRIPLESWDYSVYKKFKRHETGESAGGAVFLVRSEKNTLTSLRVVFAGDVVLRDKNSESLLIGKRLPLDRKDAAGFTERWNVYLDGVGNQDALFRSTLLTFITASLEALVA